MPQMYTSSTNPHYAVAGANLGEAIFGKPETAAESMKATLYAAQTRQAQLNGDKLSNQVLGQQTYKNVMSGLDGQQDPTQYLGGHAGELAAAMGLAGIKRDYVTIPALNPAFGEADQQRLSVASGDADSMGIQQAKINTTNAQTNQRNASTAKLNRTPVGGTGGTTVNGKPAKKVALSPGALSKLKDETLNTFSGDEIDPGLKKTLQNSPDLGNILLQAISNNYQQTGGDSGATILAAHDTLGALLDKNKTRGVNNPFVSNRYVIDPVNNAAPAGSVNIPAKPAGSAGQKAPQRLRYNPATGNLE